MLHTRRFTTTFIHFSAPNVVLYYHYYSRILTYNKEAPFLHTVHVCLPLQPVATVPQSSNRIPLYTNTHRNKHTKRDSSMPKKKIENLVTNINETEELNVILEECPKHLLGKF